MTKEEQQYCMDQLQVMETAVANPSVPQWREELAQFATLVETLEAGVENLETEIQNLETGKADKYPSNGKQSPKVGTLLASKTDLENAIAKKEDYYDQQKVKDDLDKMWEMLYSLEPQKVKLWSKFPVKSLNASITGFNVSATALEVGVTGFSLVLKGAYICLGGTSTTRSGVKFGLEGLKSWFFLVSVLTCGLSGVIALIRARLSLYSAKNAALRTIAGAVTKVAAVSLNA